MPKRSILLVRFLWSLTKKRVACHDPQPPDGVVIALERPPETSAPLATPQHRTHPEGPAVGGRSFPAPTLPGHLKAEQGLFPSHRRPVGRVRVYFFIPRHDECQTRPVWDCRFSDCRVSRPLGWLTGGCVWGGSPMVVPDASCLEYTRFYWSISSRTLHGTASSDCRPRQPPQRP